MPATSEPEGPPGPRPEAPGAAPPPRAGAEGGPQPRRSPRLLRAWHRWPNRRKVIAALMAFLALWLAMLFAAPYMLPADTVDFGEGGLAGRNEFAAERDRLNMTGWVRFVYWEGDVNHHLKANRSFFLNGNQMPEDTRDIGIYFGGLAGLGLYYRRSYPLPLWAILAGLAPMGMDGTIQLTGIYESANWLRVLTGFVSGLTLGMVVAYLGTDIAYHRGLRRAMAEGRPYRPPPPPLPRTYLRAFLFVMAASVLVTAARIVWYVW